jgi:uncharacterized protein YkwD
MLMASRRRAQRLALALLVAAATPGAAAEACSGTPAETTLCLVNSERAAAGLEPVQPDARLARAALAYSREMVAGGYFQHVAPSGDGPVERVKQTGWLRRRSNWSLGETLAWGTGQLGTPEGVVAAWMRSPGHRRIVLRPEFRLVGIGIAAGTPYGAPGSGETFTAEFGAGRVVPSQHCLPRRARAPRRCIPARR